MQEHTHMYIYTNCKEKERERAENALLLINKVEEFVHASFLMLPASTRLLPLSHCLAPSFVSTHTQTQRGRETSCRSECSAPFCNLCTNVPTNINVYMHGTYKRNMYARVKYVYNMHMYVCM